MIPTMGLPRQSGGMNGAAGAQRRTSTSVSRRGADAALRRIHEDALHPGHVEGQSALRHSRTGDVMAAAFDGEEEAAASREVHTLDHVRCSGRADDECGLLIDHSIPQLSRVLVGRVSGPYQRAAEAASESFDVVRSERNGSAVDAQCRDVLLFAHRIPPGRFSATPCVMEPGLYVSLFSSVLLNAWATT